MNLVITTACKTPIIQNTLDIVKEVTMMSVKGKFGKYNSLNPFLPNVSFLYILKKSENKRFSLKKSENKRFSDVFMGYEKGTLKRNGLQSGGKYFLH